MINTTLILLVSNLIPATLVVTAKALEETNCEDDEFKCKDGYCYPKFLVCRDEDENCDVSSVDRICDAIIEADCSIMHSHLCGDGTCISRRKLCNGVEDCNDASDELNCDPRCKDDEFRCGHGMCIPKVWECNGVYDCYDNSDEMYCHRDMTCSNIAFRCGDGMCIPKGWVCNEKEDCNDASDELNCRRVSSTNTYKDTTTTVVDNDWLSETVNQSDCVDDYCQNNGECEINDNIRVCRCPDGFEGEWCEIGNLGNSSQSITIISLMLIIVLVCYILRAM